MLVLSRKVGERILVGDQITITVVRVTNGGVRLGIEAPGEMTVVREEVKTGKNRQKPPSGTNSNPLSGVPRPS